MSDKTLLIIAGPTAIGKTALAVQLAQYFNTAVLSADARQCYKEMQIGTAKPSIEEQQGIPHYFIDSHPLSEALSVADYEQYAISVLEQLFLEKDIVLVCGGTGLYINALCDGLDTMPPADSEIEEAVNQLYASGGIAALQFALQEEDSLFAQNGAMQNPHRMLRALAFKRSVGESILLYQTHTQKERPFKCVKIALEMPRAILYDRINHRVDNMLAEGLLDEVKSLLSFREHKNFQTVGYQEWLPFFDHTASIEACIDKVKQHTRNYAKRQMTWFKNKGNFIHLNALDNDLLQQVLLEIKKANA